MKSKALLILAWIMLFAASNITAQKNPGNISDYINPEELKHPYLLFDQEGKEQMLEAIEKNQELAEIYEKQILAADRYLRMPKDYKMPDRKPDDEYYGILRAYQYDHLGPARSLAFAYQMTGNPAYAEKAFFHAEMLCKIDAWNYVFHQFPHIYRRVWPYGVDDDKVVFSYDIQTARISTHLALVYDWIYDYMDKGQRDRIRSALLEKSILPVRGNLDYFWWSDAVRCNWSAVCHSGAGIASLALLREDPQLIDVVESSYKGVSNVMDEIGIDGGWIEGRGYWDYMVSHSTWFMEAVNRSTDGAFNLFLHPRLANNLVDFVMYTLPADFCDGGKGPEGESWMVNKIIAETGQQTAAWYRDTFLELDESIYDLIFRKPDVESKKPDLKSKHFRTIHWAAMQTSFTDENTVTVVCKAGKNDDPHHGHLDCGQFIVNYKDNNFISEPAKAEYDLYYFAKERWDYLQASSEGHNVVSVNGEHQIPAKIKNKPWRNVGTDIDEFYTSDKQDYVVMKNLEKAYPAKEMTSWERKIVLDKPNLTVVIDKIGSEKNAEIRSRIHPGGTLEMKRNYYIITSDKGDVMAVVPFSDQQFTLEKRRHPSLRTHTWSRFQWIPYIDTYTKTKNNRTTMGYLIFPYTSEEETGGIINSIQIQSGSGEEINVSFSFSGEKNEISF